MVLAVNKGSSKKPAKPSNGSKDRGVADEAKKLFQVYLPPKVIQWIDNQAKSEGLTMAAWARRDFLQRMKDDQELGGGSTR